MAVDYWRETADQQRHQQTDLWASGDIVLAVIVFPSLYSQNKLTADVHFIPLNLIYSHSRHERTEARFLSPSWGDLIWLDQKTWFFLSSLVHKLFALAPLKPPHLFPQCVNVLVCMRLWWISAVLPIVSRVLPVLLRPFDEALLSLLPIVTKKGIIHVWYLQLPSWSFGDKRTVSMHGFSECQLPAHLWILPSMKEGWENQVFLDIQLCSSVPLQLDMREEDETNTWQLSNKRLKLQTPFIMNLNKRKDPPGSPFGGWWDVLRLCLCQIGASTETRFGCRENSCCNLKCCCLTEL